MDLLGKVRRDGESGGLGLGALLAIALCGGIVVFSTFGFLMAWRIKVRQRQAATKLYTIPDEFSQSRLTKRPLHTTESAVSGLSSRFSSRFSLILPPIIPLPPLPSYNSFNFFRAPSKPTKEKKERRSWVTGDDFHGPQVNKDAMQGWSRKDSWYGGMPTMPSLEMAEKGGAHVQIEHIVESDKLFRQRSLEQKQHYVEYRTQQQQQQQQQQPPQQQHQLRQQNAQYVYQHQYHQQQQQQHHNELHVQKNRSGNNLQSGQSPQTFASQDNVPRGRQSAIRVPAQAHVRPSLAMTDLGLRDILRSTDQRLREGTSRSPTKQSAQSSPTRGSPVKTSLNGRRTSVRGHGRYTRASPAPSPSKGGNLTTSASVTSIGSAANSLIAEAMQELELPGGMASPSRLRGREWEPRGDQVLPPSAPGLESPAQSANVTPRGSPQRSPQRSMSQRTVHRRRSVDSDQSSSLSTLYSVGEPESEHDAHTKQHQHGGYQESSQSLPTGNDPFVEDGGVPVHVMGYAEHATPIGSRPSKRENIMSPSQFIFPTNLSPMSQPQGVHPADSSANLGINPQHEAPSPLVLRPPQMTAQSDEVRAKTEMATEKVQLQQSESGSSFTSASVHSLDSDTAQTDDSEATALPCETPKSEWLPPSHWSRSPTASPFTPNKGENKQDDNSSSPFSEQDILSMLLNNRGNKRALPQPPLAVISPDGSVLPTVLSPMPSIKSNAGSPRRKLSTSSSYYAGPTLNDVSAISNGSPTRRGTNRSHRAAPTLGLAIAELRRMNSIVSSYSNASIASTVMAETEPALTQSVFGAKALPPRQVPKPGAIGSRHYFNIGKSGSPKGRPNSPLKPHEATKISDKENEGPGNGRSELPCLREVRQNPPRPRREGASPTGSRVQGLKMKHGPVADLLAREKRVAASRDSVESLGLYDKDGFLLSSPEREARQRGLRM